jgi:hypothetical protein
MSDQSRSLRALPARPNLDYLRKMAKKRLDELRRTDGSAPLADAQRDVAREHGFASWRRLHAHVTQLRQAAESSSEVSPDAQIARGGHLETVKLLVEMGAKASWRNSEGKTPLDLARERPDRAGCVKMADWLTAHLGAPRSA